MGGKVSIIIPVNSSRNTRGAQYLRCAIESTLAQTYENIEVIVVNDGSEDNGESEKTALSFGDRIRYFYKQNGGVSSALNLGIQKAEGDWISWLSHDDLYTPDKIAVQMQSAEKLKAAGKDYSHCMYYCGGGFIDSDGNVLKKSMNVPCAGFCVGRDVLYYMFKGLNIGGCGLLIPRGMFEETGFFDENMRYSQDQFMWFRAFLAGYGMYSDNRIMSYTRLHNMQTSTTGKQYLMRDRERIAEYMSHELEGVCDTKGRKLFKEYMFMCSFSGVEDISRKMYEKLKASGEADLFDGCKLHILNYMGKVRRELARKYYLIRFGVKR